MKYLLVLMVLLSGCNSSPKFKVGDLVCSNSAVESEFSRTLTANDITMVRIEKVGKKHYLYVIWNHYDQVWIKSEPYEDSFRLLDDYRHICTNDELMAVSFE